MIMGKTMHMWRQRIYGKSLYPLLNFAVKKTIFSSEKSKALIKKKYLSTKQSKYKKIKDHTHINPYGNPPYTS